MIVFAVSFICGITVFSFFQFFPFSIILCVVVTVCLFFRHHGNKNKVFFVILIFASGFLYSFIRQETLPEIKFPARDLSIEGTVTDIPELSFEKIRFTINNVYVERLQLKGKIRLSANPNTHVIGGTKEHGNVIVIPRFNRGIQRTREKGLDSLVKPENDIFGANMFSELPEDLPSHYAIVRGLLPAYGDRVKIFARLNEPAAFHNFNVYSYDPRADGIIGSAYIKQIEILSRGDGILPWLYKKRQTLARIIDNSLSKENAPFHKAIILGLQKGITPETRDAFIATGLAHLLSISGTHFGLLAFILFTIIRTITKLLPMRNLTRITLYVTPTEIAIVLTMPILIMYALISGASTPTIRSFIMISVFMLALILGRKGQWLNSLSIAAIVILLWQPKSLFDLSFQLSFIAVLSIGYVLEKRAEDNPPLSPFSKGGQRGIIKGKAGKIRKTFEGVKTSMFITSSAVIGTAPIVVYFFHQFSLISPLTNLIITPLVCFVILPLGFFGGFSALLLNMNFLPLNGLIDGITTFSLNLIKTASLIPYSNLHLHKPLIIIVILYFLSLAFIVKGKPRTNLVRGKSKWRIIPFALIITLYTLSPLLFTDNSLKITFLDVGQGDSAVIELPDKKAMLIDGGSKNYDAGKRVLAPYLWAKGIRKVDYLVLSHPHPDHYGGLIYIMDNFKVGEVWLNGRRIPEAEVFFQKLKEKGIYYKALKRGDLLEEKGYKIYAFHPYNEFYADSPRGDFSNQNNDSLVLKIEFNGAAALFTGDIEMEAEENLVYLGKWLKSDIIKVPHHGGRTSSTAEFIKTVNPKIAVISAGKNNPFNHPHEETIKRYGSSGVRLLRTDTDGAVRVVFKEGAYEIKTYWDSRFKKVTNLRDEIRNLRLLVSSF
ncbi:MAG: DNA internalization-related competence protein ComEC/Rec2 [Nitrospirae bacterium]|nr:DNA internalization-related competence protein ComEC/Rec2 [Nitrospirota bacterium]